jgi:hypothetical protein
MCIKIVGTGSGSGANPIIEVDGFIDGKKKKNRKKNCGEIFESRFLFRL